VRITGTECHSQKLFAAFFSTWDYPVFNPPEIITYHKNYPKMIAEILKIPCPRPLTFKGGNALTELKEQVVTLKKAAI
jgi:hypothetical protein